ncbi:dynein heavy chain, partial [Reticulomyxa filosa]
MADLDIALLKQQMTEYRNSLKKCEELHSLDGLAPLVMNQPHQTSENREKSVGDNTLLQTIVKNQTEKMPTSSSDSGLFKEHEQKREEKRGEDANADNANDNDDDDDNNNNNNNNNNDDEDEQMGNLATAVEEEDEFIKRIREIRNDYINEWKMMDFKRTQ